MEVHIVQYLHYSVDMYKKIILGVYTYVYNFVEFKDVHIYVYVTCIYVVY